MCKNTFNALRKHHRKNYKKSRKVKKKGWDHLNCSICDEMYAGIRSERDEEKKSVMRAAMTRHREHYVRIQFVFLLNALDDSSFV